MFEFESVHIGDALLFCFGPGPVSNTDWARVMTEMRRKPITRIITAAMGANEFSSLSRKEGNTYVRDHRIRVSIITDDRIARGLVTAASWVGADVRAFSWKDLRAAFEDAFVDRAQAVEAEAKLLFFRRVLEQRQHQIIKKAG